MLGAETGAGEINTQEFVLNHTTIHNILQFVTGTVYINYTGKYKMTSVNLCVYLCIRLINTLCITAFSLTIDSTVKVPR